ncbi:MAG: amino acid ABC transporter substrate-binding protein, partial [Planctomycetes bacterium]|nr:amino acid ABC transporter substrate-binding protein [Planctomycetota bacterium]
IEANNIEDFAGLTMGRLDGSAFGQQFEPLIYDGRLTVNHADSNDSLFRMLVRNRVDFIPEQLKSGYDAIDNLPSSETPKNLTHYPSFSYKWNYHLLISKVTKRGPYFVDAFNRGIAMMAKDGSLAEILNPLIKPTRDQ